jgi:nicotinate-nucleotide adenylyltransferase
MKSVRAIGILGGTFDPVHNAHLEMARAALENLSLQNILFIPTGSPNYYRNGPVASAEHRLAMLRLALGSEPRYRIDERELAPGASGYTVDTLKSLRAELGPKAALHFLMGSDQFKKLPSWHRPEELRKLAKIALFARPGFETGDEDVQIVPMRPMPISASDIRQRAARGENIAAMVPSNVANYIRTHQLYS